MPFNYNNNMDAYLKNSAICCKSSVASFFYGETLVPTTAARWVNKATITKNTTAFTKNEQSLQKGIVLESG